MTKVVGTAKVQVGGLAASATPMVPRVDGPVLRETSLALEADGMKRPVLEKVKEQSVHILGAILGTYAAHVASGEVGPDGSGNSQDRTGVVAPA